ncbi:MAG: cytochrome c [Thiobacillaceae bacterium]
MMQRWALTLLLGAASSAIHAANPGDPKLGKTLHDRSCVSCHRSIYGGDGSRMYLRPDHKVRSLKQLANRTSFCNANAGAGWFPEEEAAVTAYLNQQYYKFK